MKKPIFLLSLFLLFFCFNFLSGQEESGRKGSFEPYQIYLKVLPASEPMSPEDTVFGLIRIPHFNLILKPGTSGLVYDIYSSPEIEINKQGSFQILPLEEDYWWGMYHLNEKGRDLFDSSILPDGIVAIEVEVPYRPYRSIFFEMFRSGVEFTDVFEDSFYSVAEIIDSDSRELEAKWLSAMLDDVKFTAAEMKKTMNSPMIEGGRYDGNDLFSAMEKSTDLDVRSFLRYVESKPTKYRGNAWKISETYATWLVSQSPSTSDDLLELLSLSYQKDEVFYRYISDTEYQVLEAWLPDWREQGDRELENGRLYNAKNIFQVCVKVSQLIDNNEETGWSFFSLAEAFGDEDLEKRLEYYLAATEQFQIAEDKAGLIAAQNNLGYIYNDLEKYQKAQEVLEKAYSLEKEVIPNPDNPTSVTVALTLRHLGNSFLGQKKYKKALNCYEEGLKFVTHSRPVALKRKAAIFFQMGEAYKALGQDEDYGFYTELGVATFQEYEKAVKRSKKM